LLIGKYYNGIEVYRENKMIYAKFLNPHRTISTCRVNGGFREDLDCLVNHQSCEPNGHYREALNLAISDPPQYLETLCKTEDLPPHKTACLSTATNMHHAAWESVKYREIEVIAVSTGGVETNAVRAADPASYYENEGRFESVDDKRYPAEGTINTMIFINKELIPGAMVSALIVAAEAKAAAMQELSVNSRYSTAMATGTGTDQIAIACQLGGQFPLSQADKHAKLGELIGVTVKQTVKKTLALNNEYTPGARARVTVQLARFGIQPSQWVAQICDRLPADQAKIFNNNFEGIDRDPLVVAAVAAILHLRDQFSWGILPLDCLADIMCAHGAQIAAAISGKYERISHYRNRLAGRQIDVQDSVFLEFIEKSIVLGYKEKWAG
jgi:adenosylcobinamide amidohydrolase